MKFILYQDNAKSWRWRLVSSNGNIIADCGQGYASKRSALRGIELVQNVTKETLTEEVK